MNLRQPWGFDAASDFWAKANPGEVNLATHMMTSIEEIGTMKRLEQIVFEVMIPENAHKV